MTLSCIVSEIKRAIDRKTRLFHAVPAFDAPVRGLRPNIGREQTDILRQHSPRCAYVSRGKKSFAFGIVYTCLRLFRLSLNKIEPSCHNATEIRTVYLLAEKNRADPKTL